MNSRAKFVFSIGLLCLMVPGSLRADTIYTYTGNAYTTCSGTYTCNGTTPFLSLTFDTTLKGAQLANLAIFTVAGGNLSAYVPSFSVSDGTGFSLTQSNASPSFFDVATDANGRISAWNIAINLFPTFGTPGRAGTESLPPSFQTTLVDSSGTATDQGFEVNNPGTWTPPVGAPVPEPSSVVLMLSGIGFIFLLVLKGK